MNRKSSPSKLPPQRDNLSPRKTHNFTKNHSKNISITDSIQ